MKEEIESYSDAWKINPEIEKLVKAPSGLVKILNPSMVLDMFSRIPDEDIQYLLMNSANDLFGFLKCIASVTVRNHDPGNFWTAVKKLRSKRI